MSAVWGTDSSRQNHVQVRASTTRQRGTADALVRRMRLRLALALSAFAVAPVYAQPNVAPPATSAVTDEMAAFEQDVNALFVGGGLTAEQAAVRAAKVSPTAKRKVAEVEVAIAQAQAAELARIPQIGAKLSYTRLSPVSIEFGAGIPAIELPVNNYGSQAQIVVPLSDYVLRFPKLLEAAKAATEVARTSKISAEVNAGQEARLAYYEWIRAKLQVLIARRQLGQVQSVLKQVRALAEAQRLNKADLMRVESNEAQAEQVVFQLQNLEALREEQLRITIGADAGEQLSPGEDVRAELAAPTAGNLDEMVKAAVASRLEVKILDAGIDAKTKQRDSEKASKLPRLSAFAQGDYANPNQRIFPQTNEWNVTWQAGVQLTWTLNDTLLADTTLNRLAAETNELRADRENLLRGARIEVLASQQAVLLAQQSLATSAKGLAAAEEGYRVRRELLNADRATAVELVDAETDLTRARIAALNARVDLRVAITQLAHALGQDIGPKR
jgi:outer membrane protein TolC